jgi:signal transduction histidine kinase
MSPALSSASESDVHDLVSPTPVSDPAARAHEQMNALSVIISVASLVRPGLSERDRVRMARLDRAVRRLEELIRTDGENVSPLEPTTTAATTNVEAIVRGACELLHDKTGQAGIKLVVDCGGGVLRGNAAILQETLFNLLGTAIESAGPGQEVHLETRTTHAGDQSWTIRHPRVGAPARVMLSATVAMSLGGSLAFESRENEGTTVRVWLPREGRKGDTQTVSVRLHAVDPMVES